MQTTVKEAKTAVCTKCGIEKPLSKFYRKSASNNGRRSECKACGRVREKARYESMKIIGEDKRRDNVIRGTIIEMNRFLAAAVIHQAWLDARGKIESSNGHSSKRRVEIVNDARNFFHDGRFGHYAEYLELNPEILPPGIK